MKWGYRAGSRLSSSPTNPTVFTFSFSWLNPLQIVVSLSFNIQRSGKSEFCNLADFVAFREE